MPPRISSIREAEDQPLLYLHWALVLALVYLVVLGEPGGALPPSSHLLYVAVLLGGSAALPRIPFPNEGRLATALVGFDTVFALIGLAIVGSSPSQDLLIGYFLAIVIASLGDSQGRLAGAALLGTAAYALWMLRGDDLLRSSPLLLRLPFLFVATLFYGVVMQRARSERQYRRMFEDSPHPMWLQDESTRALLEANDAAVRAFGYSRRELRGMTLEDLLPVEGSLRRKDGSGVDVEVMATPVLFAGRSARLAIVSDVTLRRRAEAETRQALALLRSVVESTGDGLLVVSPERRLTLHNSRFAEMWRLPREALDSGDDERVLGCMLEQLADPQSLLDRVRDPHHGADEESSDLVRFKDGRVFEGTSMPPRVEDPAIGRVWSFRDVTARVRAEDEARRFGARYRTLLEGIPLGVYRTNATGEFEDVNRALARMLGFPEGEALRGVRVAAVFADPSEWAQLRGRMERDGGVRSFEVDLRRRDGTIVQGAITARAVRDERGREAGCDGVVEDVTERRKSEEMLLEALQKSEQSDWLKGNFLATMSHEIRTPLNIILGYSELLGGDGDDASAELVQAIRRASQRLINTVHGMLDLAKLQSSSFECRPVELDLVKVVEERVQPFQALAKRRGLEIVCRFEVRGVEVRFDEYCLAKTLDSLLDNAVKFTPRGEIRVRVARDDLEGLRVEVKDTGIGISAEHLPRLFEPFAQEHLGDARPFEGAGVSLAVAKRLVELNGGSITVESQKGVGSIFTLHFDRGSEVVASPHRAGIGGGNGNGRAAKPTILVVEDDEDSQTYVETILGRGFRLLKASTAREARELLAVEPLEIHLVLMDVSLKGDEDGLDLTRHIRAHPQLRDVPVVATTAHALQEWRLRAFEAGCNAFLSKPFSPRQLLAAVEQFLPEPGERPVDGPGER